LRQKTTDNFLANSLTALKRLILAHVSQIGRYQHQVFGTELSGGLAGQQQLKEFFIRLM
jgi:hypothetical protein